MNVMTLLDEIETREFKPGTTGWTADDLDDPEFGHLWDSGRFEIVEGVLTLMPPAYFDGSAAMQELIHLAKRHVDNTSIRGKFATEVDLIVGRKRVARVDAVFATTDDLQRQLQKNAGRAKPHVKYGRLRIAPTFAIESISLGHEDHDRETKRKWYAEMGVPHYWILDAFTRSLECLKLVGDQYERDCYGEKDGQVRPSVFPGLVITLSDLWV
jgi:Uma2 family endonuclease